MQKKLQTRFYEKHFSAWLIDIGEFEINNFLDQYFISYLFCHLKIMNLLGHDDDGASYHVVYHAMISDLLLLALFSCQQK